MLTELTSSEIREILSENYIGRIGCRNGDRVYIFPVNYVFEDGMVYCQSYEGTKVSMMRENPDVCFEVEEIRDFNQWKSVLGWGFFEELVSPRDIRSAQLHFSEIMLAQKASLTSQPPTDQTNTARGKPPTIIYYRIRFDELSGRTERSI